MIRSMSEPVAARALPAARVLQGWLCRIPADESKPERLLELSLVEKGPASMAGIWNKTLAPHEKPAEVVPAAVVLLDQPQQLPTLYVVRQAGEVVFVSTAHDIAQGFAASRARGEPTGTVTIEAAPYALLTPIEPAVAVVDDPKAEAQREGDLADGLIDSTLSGAPAAGEPYRVEVLELLQADGTSRVLDVAHEDAGALPRPEALRRHLRRRGLRGRVRTRLLEIEPSVAAGR